MRVTCGSPAGCLLGDRSVLGTKPYRTPKDAVVRGARSPRLTCRTCGGPGGQRLLWRPVGAVWGQQAWELGKAGSTPSTCLSPGVELGNSGSPRPPVPHLQGAEMTKTYPGDVVTGGTLRWLGSSSLFILPVCT